jgi:hypothetical protein
MSEEINEMGERDERDVMSNEIYNQKWLEAEREVRLTRRLEKIEAILPALEVKQGPEVDPIKPEPIGKDRNGTDVYEGDWIAGFDWGGDHTSTFTTTGYMNGCFWRADGVGTGSNLCVLWRPGPNNPNYRGE